MNKGATNMKIKPLRDLLLIQLDEPKKQSESGIFITKAWEDAISSCTVLEVGPAVKTVKKGDHIHINPYAYLDITDSELKIIQEGDVLGHVG